jgi:hypothetical protein
VGEFEAGSTPRLKAVPTRGSRFVQWTGCSTVVSENVCSLTMSGDTSVTAEFEPFPQQELTVAKLGTGFGEVRSIPPGVECGATCEASFDEGALVSLTAATAPPNRFAGWTGCESEPEPGVCAVRMGAARSVSADFVLVPAPEPEEASARRVRPSIPPLPALPAVVSPALRIGSPLARGATVELPVTVPGPGEVAATGAGLVSTTALALRRGNLMLALHLNAGEMRQLRRSGRRRLVVIARVAFVPFDEDPSLHAGKKVIFSRAGRGR